MQGIVGERESAHYVAQGMGRAQYYSVNRRTYGLRSSIWVISGNLQTSTTGKPRRAPIELARKLASLAIIDIVMNASGVIANRSGKYPAKINLDIVTVYIGRAVIESARIAFKATNQRALQISEEVG